jgi:WD40 repeat protein
MDTQRFIQTCGAAILHSTPHLYLSALPLAPTQSMIFQKFASRFPRIPQVVAGSVMQWPVTEKTLHADSPVCAIAISRDERRIVCGLGSGMIQMWDMETGEALDVPLRGHTRPVRSLAISPNGSRIVSGSNDCTIRVWDADTGKPMGVPLQGHTDLIFSVAISPDGSRIVSGSKDHTIRVWDADTGKPMGVPLQGHTSWVWSVAISPDGSHIVSGSHDGAVWVWDADTGKPMSVPVQGHTTSTLTGLHLLQSQQMEVTLCQVQMTTQSGCGMQILASQWVCLCKGTLTGLDLLQSHQMEVELRGAMAGRDKNIGWFHSCSR